MRRFLVAAIALSATVGALLGAVITGSLSPSTAVSAPADSARVGGPPAAAPALDRASAPPGPSPAGSPTTSPALPAAAPPMSFADVAERVNPAVVNIDTLSHEYPAAADGERRRRGDLRGSTDRDGLRRSAGTGFLVDADGYILTNDHVVRDAERLTVRLKDGRSLRARRIGSDPVTDLALIKVDAAAPLPFVALGDSDRLRVGEWVVAIGNPLAYEHTVTVGIVSFIGRKLSDASLDRYIQTDAAINLGNSGGPLIDGRGEVVGINAAVSARAASIGFAIPINDARAILPELRQGRVSRGYIGVTLRALDADLRKSLGLRAEAGAVVQDVATGSPGDRAGLRVYDVVVAMDGQAIGSDDQLSQMIAARRPGTTATLQLVRRNHPVSVIVKLAERPAEGGRRLPDGVERPVPSVRVGASFGLAVRSIERESARRLTPGDDMRGVMVSHVTPMSPAYNARFQQGHVILEINRQPVPSVREFQRIVASAKPGDILTCYVYQPERRQHALLTLTLD